MLNKTVKWIMVSVFMLVAAIVIAEYALDALALNETSIAAESQELQGIQGADETTIVVQKTKMRKSGSSGEKAARSMDAIHKDKIEQFKVINGALGTQANLYKAQKEGQDSKTGKLTCKLQKEIPMAKSALSKLRKLTDEEIRIINSTTKDKVAIRVAEATYSSWESGVKSLKVEPLSESELNATKAEIGKHSEVAINGGQKQAEQVSANDLSAQDKKILKENVVGNGRNIFSNMQNVMQEMQKTMQSFMKQLQGGNPMKMMSDAKNGKGAFSQESFQQLQKNFEGIAKQMQSFMGNFGPFMKTVGGLVGEEVSVPSLPGFGSLMSQMSGGLGGAPSGLPGKMKNPFGN